MSEISLTEKDLGIFLKSVTNPPELSDPIKERFIKSLNTWDRLSLGSDKEIHDVTTED
jgi:hypothetical protein